MAKKIIVKVQVPIMSNDPNAGVLVYDEPHKIMQEFPLTREIVKAVGPQKKAFFYAHVNCRKMLVLDGKAPWQDW